MSIEDRIGSAIRYRDGSYVMRLSENFATADNHNQIFYAESDPNNNAAAYVSSNGNLFTFLFLILGLVLLVVLIGILLAQFFVYRRGLKQEEEYLRMCRRYDKQLNTPAVNRKGSQRSLSKKNSKKDFADSFMNQSNNAAPVVAYGGYNNNNNAIPQTNSTVASNRDYYNSAFNPLQPYGANNNTNNNGYDYNANVNIYSTTSNNTTSAAAPAYDPYGTSGTGYGGYNNNNCSSTGPSALQLVCQEC
ncbi:hypothetical protein ADEAN_000768100 [Angomonas deanei]|uniref:Uncharacterized protein n=1 Tax=Angomonas deanei TaxID=59799 RepID=A0A7G2CK28_9TRYP|nr:hypothetical protein ADEAN_000768100 [Angomonas deanei]